MRYFVLTCQYNEQHMLPRFVDHYSRFLAPEDIKVLDHGVRNCWDQLKDRCDRIYLPRHRPYGEGPRLRIIQHMVSGLLEYYDFGIFVDCDELIDLTGIDHISFEQYRIHFVAGFDVYRTEDRRILGLLNPGMCKPSIFSYLPYWTPGFHTCQDPIHFLNLPMAHTRYLDTASIIQRLDSRREIIESWTYEEEKHSLNQHWHQQRYHLEKFQQCQQSVTEVLPFWGIDPAIFQDRDPKNGYDFSTTAWDLTAHFPNLI